jgi:cellulose synthase/poly-beta-1,6-N-acetylglucosamine synthase-like glycosyltransferase
MLGLSHTIIYILLFISLYFEVFMLVTYLENRGDLKKEVFASHKNPTRYPSVSIIVPCWNEESTLSKTVHSLLNLNYPKDKLDILIIDDGSTDNTFSVAKTFEQYQNVRVFKKENGGKHTALNFGLTHSTSEFVGCLDADSYVEKDALKNIVLVFESDVDLMAVTPSVKIFEPKSIIQLIQSVEYIWAIFLRKMLSYMGAIYVTPGPFSIFKREVFAQVGPYREAHKTEDMEMAMRMQKNKMKIGNAHNATIYTSAPDSLKKLYKQRLRWTYGFIKNASDYRFMFFKKEYGNLGLLVLPLAILSIFATVYAAVITVTSLLSNLITQIEIVNTVGFHLPHWSLNFDWFYINTEFIALASMVAMIGTIVIVLLSRKLSLGKLRIGLDVFYFLALYSFIAPLWLGKAMYNAIFGVVTNWR